MLGIRRVERDARRDACRERPRRAASVRRASILSRCPRRWRQRRDLRRHGTLDARVDARIASNDGENAPDAVREQRRRMVNARRHRRRLGRHRLQNRPSTHRLVVARDYVVYRTGAHRHRARVVAISGPARMSRSAERAVGGAAGIRVRGAIVDHRAQYCGIARHPERRGRAGTRE